MRCSFIVPLLSSHSLIRYGESVLTERALITTLNRSSDPLRVRAPVRACVRARARARVCVCVHARVSRVGVQRPTILVKPRGTKLVDKVDQASNTERMRIGENDSRSDSVSYERSRKRASRLTVRPARRV